MIYRLHTGGKECNTRLDLYLSSQTGLSRTVVRKIIDLGGVHIDGHRVRRCGISLQENQRIELHQDGQKLHPFRLAASHIIFQDEYLIVLDKPAGIECQPTPARFKGTLYEALLSLLNEQGVRNPKIGMHQRLDRETSGLLVFSTHPKAHKNIAQQLQQRKLHREYLALVSGIPDPPAGTIQTHLARRRCSNQMISVDHGGKKAITHYETRESFIAGEESCSMLTVVLATGRSHQIRAHLSEKGHPLLGDQRYGGATRHHGKEYPRQCLHSYRLTLQHPKTGKSLRFDAAPPQEILP